MRRKGLRRINYVHGVIARLVQGAGQSQRERAALGRRGCGIRARHRYAGRERSARIHVDGPGRDDSRTVGRQLTGDELDRDEPERPLVAMRVVAREQGLRKCGALLLREDAVACWMDRIGFLENGAPQRSKIKHVRPAPGERSGAPPVRSDGVRAVKRSVRVQRSARVFIQHAAGEVAISVGGKTSGRGKCAARCGISQQKGKVSVERSGIESRIGSLLRSHARNLLRRVGAHEYRPSRAIRRRS